MPRTDVDVVVVGGGLAGTAAAEAAWSVGRDVLWLDDGTPGASDTPVALVHPFAGGSFRPREHAVDAWREAVRWFSRAGGTTVHRAVLRRHVTPGPRGDRLRNSWPLAEGVARSLFPQVMSSQDGQWFEYGPVMGIDLGAVLARRRMSLAGAGVGMQRARAEAVRRVGDRWAIDTGEGMVRARTAVLAAGAGSVSLLAPLMQTEALVRAEGVLAHAAAAPAEDRFVVCGGHVSRSPSRVAWGATYRMLDAARPDAREHEPELAKIDERLRAAGAAMPPLAEAERWTGVRLVDARTRQPWVCQPQAGLHVFTAFGSQGGLWIPWHAARLARALAEPCA